ncbi:MAG: transporter substrate-binding domain-containing protein, partial [Treponema sp.]|nr:transporter substrate-binding domain-containing protein [Treponema sp.]
MKKILCSIFVLAVLFASCSKSSVKINGVDDLAGKKIGVQAGTTGESFVQNNVSGAQLKSFKTGMDAAMDLNNGAIDAVVLDELPAKE